MYLEKPEKPKKKLKYIDEVHKDRVKGERNTLHWKVMRWLKVSPPSVDRVRNSKNYILGD